jgi:hypothetical protein
MDREECLEKLFNYFEYKTSSLLEILDIPNKAAARRGGYTGVTASYLMEYVVPEANKSTFLECINELTSKNIVAKFFCTNISRVVFEKYISDYDHYRSSNNLVTMYDLERSGIALETSYKTDEDFNEEE